MAEPRRILRLHVALADIEPPIWRELDVAADLTLEQVHLVLQRAFDWLDYHLWCFEIGGVTYGHDVEDELGFESVDRTLGSLIDGPGVRFTYVYDYGDDWRHEIEVRSETKRGATDAACVGGARAAPPEDCGGPPGYERLLEALADPSHPEHAESAHWCGEYDPEFFDVVLVDADLSEPLEARDHDLDAAIEDVLELVHTAHLHDEVRDIVAAIGPPIVPVLIDALTDPNLVEDWAQVHAVTLLADLGATDAIEPMLDVLEATETMDAIHDCIVVNLARLGAAIVEPVLARLDDVDEETRSSLLCALSECGVRDPRIYRILVEYFEVDPEMAAGELAAYGDRAALPLLTDLFDSNIPDSDNATLFVELADSIDVLGGQLTQTQAKKLDVAGMLLRTGARAPAPARKAKIGRNDPCHCGSGKKYKKCHLKADQAQPTLH